MASQEIRDAATVEVLRRIAYRARAAVLERYRRDTCILTSAVLVDLLRGIGQEAEPLTVGVVAMNLAFGALLIREGRMPIDKQELEAWRATNGAHNIGIGYGFAPGREGVGWNNHLVVTLPAYRDDPDRSRWLIDASLDQIDRPMHRIEAGIVVTRMHPDAQGRITVEIRKGIAAYEPRPHDRTYETTENWQNMNRRIAMAARANQLGDSAARILVQTRRD